MMLVAATRSWADDLEEALLEEHGEERGGELFRRYARRLPGRLPRRLGAALGARRHRPHRGAAAAPTGSAISLYRPLEAGRGRCARSCSARGAPLTLSDVLPLFENMGVEVADERPYEITPRERERRLDLRLRPDLRRRGRSRGRPACARRSRRRSSASGAARWRTTATTGWSCGAGLTWREITVLRAIGKLPAPGRDTFSDRYVEQALVRATRSRAAPGAPVPGPLRPGTRTTARTPTRWPSRIERGDRRRREPRPGPDPAQLPRRDPRDAANELLPARAGERAQAVPLVQARPVASCRWLPLPRPRFEIFVYSPRIEGVHLRGGSVARGGIRWSDRREDFRTEVLGLMKAQMVKNAVIVPVGAKGGFVVKRPPAATARRCPPRSWPATGRSSAGCST